MTKLDTNTKIDFDRSIGTEDRFMLRKWFEGLVKILNQSNSLIWEEVLGEDLVVTGFTDAPMGKTQFVEYMKNQFGDGEYLVRYPVLKASLQNGLFKFHGAFESFTDGVLTCAGDVVVEVVKDGESFKVLTESLDPTFRVQK